MFFPNPSDLRCEHKGSGQESSHRARTYMQGALQRIMAANDAMTSTRIRKYDLERLKGIAMPRESNWEVIQRLIDDYMARRL